MKYDSNKASALFELYNTLSKFAEEFKKLQRFALLGIGDDDVDIIGDAINGYGYYDYSIKNILEDKNVKSVADLYPFNDSWDESTLMDWCFVMQKITERVLVQEMKRGEVEV